MEGRKRGGVGVTCQKAFPLLLCNGSNYWSLPRIEVEVLIVVSQRRSGHSSPESLQNMKIVWFVMEFSCLRKLDKEKKISNR